jgi:NTE family protein
MGCATLPETPALTTYDPDRGYRYRNLAAGEAAGGNSEELFVIVTISGGGMRSVALGYGVLERLRELRITYKGRERRLIDEVDVIAGVSMGSLLAAHYAAHGDDLFETFPETILYRDVGADLVTKLLSPVNLLRIASPVFGRSDLVAEYYDRTIFRGLTYGDLLSRGRRPMLIVGATDLGQGWPFPFTQERFDAICADLAHFPLARAVAASSAFPGVFSSIILENRAGSCGGGESERAGEMARFTDHGRRMHVARRAEVLKAYRDTVNRPYILTSDGGPSDNIGLRTALEALEQGQGLWRLSDQLKYGGIRKLIVIAADASVQSSCVDGKDPNETGAICEMRDAVHVPFDQRSLDTWMALKHRLVETGYPTSPPWAHFVHVGFLDIADAEKRRRFYRIPTSLALPREDVDALRAIAGELMDRSPELAGLLAGPDDWPPCRHGEDARAGTIPAGDRSRRPGYDPAAVHSGTDRWPTRKSSPRRC